MALSTDQDSFPPPFFFFYVDGVLPLDQAQASDLLRFAENAFFPSHQYFPPISLRRIMTVIRRYIGFRFYPVLLLLPLKSPPVKTCAGPPLKEVNSCSGFFRREP